MPQPDRSESSSQVLSFDISCLSVFPDLGEVHGLV
jgi:hypothetical protein